MEEGPYMNQRAALDGEVAVMEDEFLEFLSSTNVGFYGGGTDSKPDAIAIAELDTAPFSIGGLTMSATASNSLSGTGSGSEEEGEEQQEFFDAAGSQHALVELQQGECEVQLEVGSGGREAGTPQANVQTSICGDDTVDAGQETATTTTTVDGGTGIGDATAPAPGRRARSLSSSRPRPSSSSSAESHSHSLRRSLSIRSSTAEPVPPIPARFLNAGRPASIATPLRHASPLLPASRSSSQSPFRSSWRRDNNYTYSTPPPPATGASTAPSSRPSTATTTTTTLAPKSAVPEHTRHTNISPSVDARPNVVETARGRRPSRQGLHSQPELHRPSSLPVTPKNTSSAQQVNVHTLSKLESRAPSETRSRSKMSRTGRRRNEDLFLNTGNDRSYIMSSEDDYTQLRRSESRVSHAGKRRSLPADIMLTPSSDRRPSTSGNIYARPQSRLYTNSNRASTDLQRHLDQYRSPTTRNAQQFGDSASVSGLSTSGRSRRFSIAPEASPVSPSRYRERVRSPELRDFARGGRQSLGEALQNQKSQRTLESHEESPAEDSEPKQTDSTSADSQTAETVWDELDDLKSRIKKLEITGKPPTSSAAASGDSSERPRTATTAPTTIDSSPKHERKQESENKTTPTPQPETPASANTLANVHPALQTALAKAKPLLNGFLFRTLEASANDALQLSSMTGGSGPQGSICSAASIINGVAVSDRQVRRKVDSMCRNLTDLCIALCEGKHEASAILTSPTSMDTVADNSPSLRYSRSSNLPQRNPSVGRPMSRLDARRSSILGVPSTGSVEGLSPRGSIADASGSEQESPQVQSYSQPRRVSRAPSSVLRSRQQRQEEGSGEDDEPTIRPASRAMTDIGALRAKSRVQPPERSPNTQRTPSLRETMMTRRTNEVAYESNREYQTPRISSLGGSDLRRRRLYDQQSTPPVVEEEDDTIQTPSSHPSQRRRITPSGQYAANRRTTGEFSVPSRTASLNHRRSVVVE